MSKEKQTDSGGSSWSFRERETYKKQVPLSPAFGIGLSTVREERKIMWGNPLTLQSKTQFRKEKAENR